MNRCKFAGRDQPRVIPGRHAEACPGTATCPGCAPCPDGHCTVCGVEHTDDAHPVTCTGCVNTVRGNLDRTLDLALRLHGEAVIRGRAGDRPGTILGGDAMVMLAMRYSDQNGEAGAWHGDWDRSHESAADPVLPLVVLGGWEDTWRAHLQQPTDATATVGAAAAYLNQHLTRMAQSLEPPFVDMADDLARLVARLESVLHDQPHGDYAGVACFDCGGRLERKLRDRKKGGPTADRGGFEDAWTCQKCRRRYTYGEYNLALRAKLETPREKDTDEKESA